MIGQSERFHMSGAAYSTPIDFVLSVMHGGSAEAAIYSSMITCECASGTLFAGGKLISASYSSIFV